ncbi:MAG TPA: hypothetical protein VN911_19390 [Candidatus Acidoferrum sp.]|nr:hypothetical protein [Candidatus Acidoferrum sp.]
MRHFAAGYRALLLFTSFSIAACLLVTTIALGQNTNSKKPLFGREVIVDNQRITGEPSMSIDGEDRIYVSTPYGFATTASFVWRSVDHGMTFHLVPGNAPPVGKPLVTCVGGGDSGLALDSANRLYFVDLQGLTDVSNSVSSDEGSTWLTTCNAANDSGVDRPWIAAFGDPQAGGALYQTVDQVEQCIGACEPNLGEVGSNIVEITRSQDGVTFSPLPAQQIEPDGIVSGIVTDSSGGVYIAHTALVDATGKLTNGSDANGSSNAIVVVRFPNGYNQATPTVLNGQTLCQAQPTLCTMEVVFRGPLDSSGNSTITVGQDFAPIAIDRAGNLYTTWAQAAVNGSTGQVSGTSQIYLAVSTNHGASWGAPVQVTAATPTLLTNLFPSVTAGDPGRVDVVWYGTPTLGSCPNQPCGSSAITAHWSVMMAQSLNAIVNGQPNSKPTFTTTPVSEVSNHYGAICTFGISCTTGGDRGLLDFITVTVGLKGEANVVWADAVNQNASGGTSSAVIGFNRQYAGPSVYANIGQVSGTAPASGHAPGSPDAIYSADSLAINASPNLMLSGASVSRPDSQHYKFTINVQSLSTLLVSPALGGTDGVWLVRWEVPDPNGAGHTYFAAMESDNGGAPSFFDGETSTLANGQGFFLTYPPAHAIQGNYKNSPSGGVITLTVPIADVGGSSNAALYSLTGLSATQSAPSSTSPVFNQIDATAPFDFTP